MNRTQCLKASPIFAASKQTQSLARETGIARARPLGPAGMPGESCLSAHGRMLIPRLTLLEDAS